MRAALLAALAVALIGVAGCGGDDDGGSGTTAATATTEESTTGSAQAAGATDVSLTDFKIDPANPKIAKAGEVTFRVKNDGGTEHNLEVEGPNGEKELSSNLAPGQTGTLQVDLSKPGKYEWYCPVGRHREFGMEGEITVAGGGGGSTTGSDTTETNTTEDSGGSGGSGY